MAIPALQLTLSTAVACSEILRCLHLCKKIQLLKLYLCKPPGHVYGINMHIQFVCALLQPFALIVLFWAIFLAGLRKALVVKSSSSKRKRSESDTSDDWGFQLELAFEE